MEKKIKFPRISVGATENAILAAAQAKGLTTLINCAIEPEIKDLINYLNFLGCNIKLKGRKITIKGSRKVKKIQYKVMFDRIELGTYLIASAIIAKKIVFNNIDPKIISTELKILKKMGVKIKIFDNKLVVLKSENIKKINLKTEPYPGFPTDLQAQMMV